MEKVILINNNKKDRVPQTRRSKFLVTLTNVTQNNKGILLKEAGTTLLNYKEGKLFGVKESHSSGTDFHFHFLWITKEGIRKNTYRKEVEKLFPEFSKGNCIRTEGVKSVKNTFNYLIKEMSLDDLIRLVSGKEVSDSVYHNITTLELKTMRKGSNNFKDGKILVDIVKYKTIKEWGRSCVGNIGLYTRKKRIVFSLWELSRSYVPVVDGLRNLLSLELDYDFFLRTKDKYGYSDVHSMFIIHLCLFLLSRSGYASLPNKRKTPILVGKPNIGKTSLIRMIIRLCGDDSFHFVGNRKGDFTGADSNLKPILVFDDILFPDRGWQRRMLIKITSGEFCWTDNKYCPVEKLLYRGAVIVSNIKGIYDKREAMKVRTKEYNILKRVAWGKMSKEELECTVGAHIQVALRLARNDSILESFLLRNNYYVFNFEEKNVFPVNKRKRLVIV